jgi:YegS/Rv2252/BmrU family lipid kinase
VNILNPRLRVEVLLNLAAGTLQGYEIDALRGRLASAFETEDVRANAEFLTPGELLDAARLARDRAERQEIDAVIVGGGDGTIHTVANVLAGTSVPMGIIPLGTLNHFARDLGIPATIDDALQIIAARHTADVDVGEVNGRIFINNSSVGVYPYIVVDRERARRDKGLGKWTAFLRSLWRVLRRLPLHRLLIRAEGRGAPFRTPCLFVGNNEYQFTLPTPGRRKRLDEGVLCLYVAKAQNRLSLFWLACRALVGAIDVGKDLEILKDSAAEIRSRRRRLPVALDGEVEILVTPLCYSIRPAALRVFVPTKGGG